MALDNPSLAPVDMIRLLFLDPWIPSVFIGLISESDTEFSLVLVSSRYRLRVLPVIEAWKSRHGQELFQYDLVNQNKQNKKANKGSMHIFSNAN